MSLEDIFPWVNIALASLLQRSLLGEEVPLLYLVQQPQVKHLSPESVMNNAASRSVYPQA